MPDESDKERPLPAFATTHWSVVLDAAKSDSPACAEALERLCQTYWFPLYAYVRRRGHDAEDAKDLVQGFFARFLEKDYLGDVDRRKGKFRSFLLASMNHYIAYETAKATAVKRGGKSVILSLDEESAEGRYLLEPSTEESPERDFERRWAVTLLREAMSRLEGEYAEAGKGELCERLKPFLTDRPEDGAYAAAGTELDLTKSAVTSLVHRMRKRYRELVREEVANTVAQPLEIDEEMGHLFRVLSR